MNTHFESERYLQLLGAYDHYDIVTAVTLKHKPVIGGIIAALLVFASPYVYAWYRRKYGPKTVAPAPSVSESVTSKMLEQKRISVEWRQAQRDKLNVLLERLKSDPVESEIRVLLDDINDEREESEGLVALGQWLLTKNKKEEATVLFSKALAIGKNSRKSKGAAEGAHHLSLLAEEEGRFAKALDFERKTLFIAERAGLNDMVLMTQQRIKTIKGHA